MNVLIPSLLERPSVLDAIVESGGSGVLDVLGDGSGFDSNAFASALADVLGGEPVLETVATETWEAWTAESEPGDVPREEEWIVMVSNRASSSGLVLPNDPFDRPRIAFRFRTHDGLEAASFDLSTSAFFMGSRLGTGAHWGAPEKGCPPPEHSMCQCRRESFRDPLGLPGMRCRGSIHNCA